MNEDAAPTEAVAAALKAEVEHWVVYYRPRVGRLARAVPPALVPIGWTQEDILQAAQEEMLVLGGRYKAERASLRTYMYNCAAWSIDVALRKARWGSQRDRQQARNTRRAEDYLCRKWGRPVSKEEIASLLGITVPELVQIRCAGRTACRVAIFSQEGQAEDSRVAGLTEFRQAEGVGGEEELIELLHARWERDTFKRLLAALDLSARDREILYCMIAGETNASIARRMIQPVKRFTL